MSKSGGRFIFLEDWYRIIACMPSEVRLALYDGLMMRYFDKVEIDWPEEVAMMGEMLSSKVDAEVARCQRISEIRSDVGKRGVQAKLSKRQANGKQTVSKSKQLLTNVEKDQDDATVPKANCDIPKVGIEISRFRKPTVDEVREYVAKMLYNVDAEAFVSYYESKGWLVGKSPMKDWKAAVRTWEVKNRKSNGRCSSRSLLSSDDKKSVVYNTHWDKYPPVDGQRNQRGEIWSERFKMWQK